MVPMMKGLSKHTELINLVIGLTKKDRTFKSYFRDIGFDIEAIEPKWTSGGQTINPDVFLLDSNNSHLLVTDCKSGSLEEHQVTNYTAISKADITNTNIVSKQISGVDFCFICFDGNLEKIEKGLETHKTILPIIVKSESKLSVKNNSFLHGGLKSMFSTELEIPQYIPTNYFPFGMNDSEPAIVSALSPSLIRFCYEQHDFTEEELIADGNEFFRSEYMQREAIDAFRGKVGNILTRLSNHDLVDYLKKIDGKWHFTSKGSKSLKRILEDYIEKLYQNRKQKTI